MSSHIWRHLAFAAIVITMLALVLGGYYVSARLNAIYPAQGMRAVPVLANPGFEGAFPPYGEVGELKVAEGWTPWYMEDPGNLISRPEYTAEQVGVGMGRVRTGSKAQKLFTTYARHDGGIYQVVEGVTPGEWYTFEIWAWQWSSGQDDPSQSTGDGKCSVLVGINPWGDERALYRTTIWGREVLQVYDQWVRVTVTVQAWSNRIVVYVRHTAEWPVKHVDVYLDDARLIVAQGPGGPTPTPPPTPEPGAEVDYERIRAIVETVIAEREPVRWPR